MTEFALICMFFVVGCYLLYRLFNPWHCACGYTTWSSKSFIAHIEMKHVHKE